MEFTMRELAGAMPNTVEELAGVLEGHLAVIAYADGYKDLADVGRRVEEVKRVYATFMDNVLLYGINPVYDAISEAYDELELLPEWGEPEYVRERAAYAMACLNSPMPAPEDIIERYPHLKQWADEQRDETAKAKKNQRSMERKLVGRRR